MKREKISEKRLRTHGPKAPFSFRRNVLPPVIGISVAAVVLLGLNGQWLLAQYNYHVKRPAVIASATQATTPTSPTDGSGSPSAAVTDTKSPHPELGPQLVIPAIGTTAPVQFNKGTAEWQIQLALRDGVVHYDGGATPGQPGNVAIFGHSSGQPWAPGNYKFVFTLLDKLKPGDVAYLDYQGTRYTYKVTSSQVVSPNDTGVLNSGNDHELTLITCTPVGTSTNRLIVHAEQVSPAPAKVTGTPAANNANLPSLPGSAR